MVVFRLTFILMILSNYAFICKSYYHNCKTVFGRSSTTYLLLKKKKHSLELRMVFIYMENVYLMDLEVDTLMNMFAVGIFF